VTIAGEQKPSIRVQIDPAKLSATGLTMEDVRVPGDGDHQFQTIVIIHSRGS
jgi:hypothetical protein